MTDDEILAALNQKKPTVQNHKIEQFPEKKETEQEETAQDYLKKIQDILKEFSGREGDIPHQHVYWGYLNHYRMLLNK